MQNTHTTMVSNGSKFAGEKPDSIETLIERLERFTLNPFLGASLLPYSVRSTRRLHVFGNFLEISAVFQVRTHEDEVSERLCQAVWLNLNSARFQTAANAYPCFPQGTLAPHLTVPQEVTMKYGVMVSRQPLFKR